MVKVEETVANVKLMILRKILKILIGEEKNNVKEQEKDQSMTDMKKDLK